MGKAMGYYAYLGPVVPHKASFIASKDGFSIGTYSTFGRLWSGLRGKNELKHLIHLGVSGDCVIYKLKHTSARRSNRELSGICERSGIGRLPPQKGTFSEIMRDKALRGT